MRKIVIITFLFLSVFSYGQTTITTQSENYKALAKLISLEGGDKVHYAKFRILKNLSNTLILPDTVIVGFYNYQQPNDDLNCALLTLKKYEGLTASENYFICPDYDGKIGIQKAKIDFFDNWESWQTLQFTRPEIEKYWFLIMPCSGTSATTISILGRTFSKDLHFAHADCPPYLDLTNLADGYYSARVSAYGLHERTVQFYLDTHNCTDCTSQKNEIGMIEKYNFEFTNNGTEMVDCFCNDWLIVTHPMSFEAY